MAKPRGLFVDDDPEILSAYRTLVKALGHEADYVEDEVQTLASVRKQQYDYVILDREIPYEHGDMPLREVGDMLLEKLREEPRMAGVPIIVVTGYDVKGPNKAVELMQKGAFDFVAKGDEQKSLRSAIERALSNSATRAVGREVLTLEQFMLRYCKNTSSRDYRLARRDAIYYALKRNLIELPPLAYPSRPGQAHKFHVKDMLKAWPVWQQAGVDLPELK